MRTDYKFNFTSLSKEGYIGVPFDAMKGVPLYDEAVGYGFIRETCALPAREVHTETIRSDGNGFVIYETEFYAEEGFEKENYNHYGMAFRIQVPPGAYEVIVRTTSDISDAYVSISGMQAGRILEGGHWDAAKLIPVKYPAVMSGNEWSYRYCNGREYLDIEIEPRTTGVPVGLEEIVLRPISSEVRTEEEAPTIFLLGDSTMKSYTFEEAPMSGWGQVIPRLFDESKGKVVNYSMGGRSFRNAYTEGRWNDILLTGKIGDYVLIQFGHNDEREDEHRRFGRGSTEDMYERYLLDLYLPAIRARGMIPVLITPMSRIKGNAQPGHRYTNSFTSRRFPDVLRRMGAEAGIPVLDLNTASLEYYNQIGVESTTALYMSIEAGETPGKTNDGSYANGHPAQKIDGTHYKEALSKQFARMVVTELASKAADGDPTARELYSFLKEEVKGAIESKGWSDIFPEMACDTTSGEGSYYRNQIEKLIQLNVLHKDDHGCFQPERTIQVSEFVDALSKLMGLNPSFCTEYSRGDLTRETMGAILYDAYQARFTSKPGYMTDYNGQTLGPGDSGYDPNLDAGVQGVQYDPLVSYEQLTDTDSIHPSLAAKVKAAYQLGLIRSEKGIARGRMINGTELEPQAKVTRAKAAKALYFMWVLGQPVHAENHTMPIKEEAH
jgi:lysophospholipase L1-like esterase